MPAALSDEEFFVGVIYDQPDARQLEGHLCGGGGGGTPSDVGLPLHPRRGRRGRERLCDSHTSPQVLWLLLGACRALRHCLRKNGET